MTALLVLFLPAFVVVGLMYLVVVLSTALVGAADRFLRWRK